MLSPKYIDSIVAYFSDKPVIRGYLFGSHVRNEENENSDIDILLEIDYSHQISLLDLIGWKLDLEEILNRKIDLVAEDGLSKHLKPIIEKEKVLIYERAA